MSFALGHLFLDFSDLTSKVVQQLLIHSLFFFVVFFCIQNNLEFHYTVLGSIDKCKNTPYLVDIMTVRYTLENWG